MVMNKIFITSLMSVLVSTVFGQLNVTPDGKVGIGINGTPISKLAVGHVGDPYMRYYFKDDIDAVLSAYRQLPQIYAVLF